MGRHPKITDDQLLQEIDKLGLSSSAVYLIAKRYDMSESRIRHKIWDMDIRKTRPRSYIRQINEGLRIYLPKNLLHELDLDINDLVDLKVEDGRLIVTKVEEVDCMSTG